MRILIAMVLTATLSLLASAPRALAEALLLVVAFVGVCAIPGFALAFVADGVVAGGDARHQPRSPCLAVPMSHTWQLAKHLNNQHYSGVNSSAPADEHVNSPTRAERGSGLCLHAILALPFALVLP